MVGSGSSERKTNVGIYTCGSVSIIHNNENTVYTAMYYFLLKTTQRKMSTQGMPNRQDKEFGYKEPWITIRRFGFKRRVCLTCGKRYVYIAPIDGLIPYESWLTTCPLCQAKAVIKLFTSDIFKN